MAFSGRVQGNILPARFGAIRLATAGNLFATATESIAVGIRKGASIERDTVAIVDAAGRPLTDMLGIKAKIDCLQTTFANVLNFYKLHKAPHQAYFKGEDGLYYAFIDNTGTIGTPNGSQLIGSQFEFQITDKERLLSLTSEVQLTNTEWDELITLSGSAPTGGTGGGTNGLTTNNYAVSSFIRSGFKDILIAGVSVGNFISPKFSMKSVEQAKDDRGRPINRKVGVQVDFTMLQTANNDLVAVSQILEQTDATITLLTRNDETITFPNGALRATTKYTFDDKNKRELVVTAKGEFVNNNTETAPPSMDIGVTVPTTITCNLTPFANS